MRIDPNAIVGAPEPVFISDKLMPEDAERLAEIFSQRKGLTIRAHFAAMAMQGIVRRFAAQGDCSTTVALDARDAVRYADALIAELNK